MPTMDGLFVILSTANENDANTDSRMRLVFERGSLRKEFELGGQPHDERERGRTDLYEFPFPQGSNVELNDITASQFKIVAAGDDAWLPSSIFILGRGQGTFRVLVANENWPEDAWFSTQGSDANGRAEKARILDRTGTPTTT